MEEQLVTLAIGESVRDPYGGVYVVEALLSKKQFEAEYLVRDQYFRQNFFLLREFVEPGTAERTRLIQESEFSRQIGQSASPRVYGIFEDAGRERAYLLMDYIPGQSAAGMRRAHLSPVASGFIHRPPSTEPSLKIAVSSSVCAWQRAAGTKKRELHLIFALVLLVGAVVGVSFFTFFSRSPHPITPTPTTPATLKTFPSPTEVRESSIYPRLAASYAGTVVDLLNNEKTAMYLAAVKQNQASLSGFLQALGLAGPFRGTVTSSGQVQFAVKVKASDMTLVFSGDIKIGGDMVGTFVVLDQRGDKTGESGIWNVAAG